MSNTSNTLTNMTNSINTTKFFTDDEISYILEPLKKFISEYEMNDVLDVFLNPEDDDDWDFYRNVNMTDDELHDVFETMFPIDYDENYDENKDDDISEVYDRLREVQNNRKKYSGII